MIIYGHFMSAPSNQVRLTASALGIEHDYRHVDLANGEQNKPDYLAINPFGKVPALIDGDFKLAESCAIARYLACKVGGDALYPIDIAQRALIDQWMDYAAHHVRANMGRVLFFKVLAPMIDVATDANSIAEGEQLLDERLPVVNETLDQRANLTGDALTIADIAMIAAMEPFETIDYDVAKFPAIDQWRKKLAGEDWYQRVHARYAAELRN